MVDLNELFSPSKWSPRLSPDVIVDFHGRIMKESNFKDKLEDKKNLSYFIILKKVIYLGLMFLTKH
jgi:hypothetical protein